MNTSPIQHFIEHSGGEICQEQYSATVVIAQSRSKEFEEFIEELFPEFKYVREENGVYTIKRRRY